ncbi:Proline-rich protein 5 [Varanus komodoensis]|nr:Proline-rich protein 5 [Varanus komodoensis]
MTSKVLQGSVLRPILFNLSINDMEEGVNSLLIKFTDDTKTGAVATSEEQVLQFQKDLNRLWKWAGDNRMAFNVDKCKVLHLGHKYRLGDKWLESSTCERDPGVLVDCRLNMSQQCDAVVKWANANLGYIARSVVFRSKEPVQQARSSWGVHESKGVTEDYLKLETLLQKVVSPYLGTYGLYSSDGPITHSSCILGNINTDVWTGCFSGRHKYNLREVVSPSKQIKHECLLDGILTHVLNHVKPLFKPASSELVAPNVLGCSFHNATVRQFIWKVVNWTGQAEECQVTFGLIKVEKHMKKTLPRHTKSSQSLRSKKYICSNFQVEGGMPCRKFMKHYSLILKEMNLPVPKTLSEARASVD